MSNPKMNLILEGLSIKEGTKKVALFPIIDTWNMLDKFGIDDYEQDKNNYNILISDKDFQRMLDGSKNKKYIEGLKVGVGSVMYGRGSF